MNLYMKIEWFSNSFYGGKTDYYRIVSVDKSKPWRTKYTFIENDKKVKMGLHESLAMEMST